MAAAQKERLLGADGGAVAKGFAVVNDVDAGGSSPEAFPLSRGRWWVLATYTLMAALQGMSWGVPGTLSPTFAAVYGFSPDLIALLLNYGPIMYLVGALPSMLVIDRFGVAAATWGGIALVVVANLVRLAANDGSLASLVIVHVSFVLIGLAGPVAMAVPSRLAEDWFPPAERTTATAIAALGNQSGAVVIYFLVPVLSPDTSRASNLRMNALLAALSVANALMAAAYLPARPPAPPSASAGAMRAEEASAPRVTLRALLATWAVLARNTPFVLITIVYSLVLGFANTTGALLPNNLAAVGGTQVTAGWLGAGANVASLVVGVCASAALDGLKRRSRGAFKATIVAATAVAGAAFAVYAAALGGSVASSVALPVAAAAWTLSSAATGVCIPAFFDFAAEITYPLPEGAMLMLTTTVMNAVSLFCLLAPQSSFYSWINYGTAGVTFASALALFFILPSKAPRMDFDLAAAAAVADPANAVAAGAYDDESSQEA